MRGCRRRGCAFVIGAIALAGVPLQGVSDDRAEVQEAMRSIFSNLRVVLPLAVDPASFRDPLHLGEIERAMEGIERQAASLETHGESLDPGRLAIGRSLDREAHRALESYRRREFPRAEFALREMANACVACHAQRQSPDDAAISSSFFKREELAGLEPLERAKLQIATRQFDEALETFESVFRSGETLPALLLGPLTDYLRVCVRVKRDYARAGATLERFAERKDLWDKLRADVQTWVADLRTLQSRGVQIGDVARARELIQ